MKLIISAIIIMCIMSVIALAGEMKTERIGESVYVIDDKGMISQTPYKVKPHQKVKLNLDTIFTKNIDMCFRFYENIKYFQIELDKIKVKDYFQDGFCIKNVKPKHDYNLTITSTKFGESKYDIIILPSSYNFDLSQATLDNEILILDPIVIGSPLLNYSFNYDDGIYNSVLAEDSASNNDSIVVGAQLGGAYIGGGYDYDGIDDYLESIPGNLSYPNSTLSFWVKPDSITAGTLFSYYNTSNVNELKVWIGAGWVNARYYGTAGCYIQRRSTDKLAVGNWTHVITSHNGTNVSIYFDGELNDAQNINFGLPCSYEEVYRTLSQGLNRLSADPFDGKIDEVMYWSDFINATQALELYNIYNYSAVTVEFQDENTQVVIPGMNSTVTDESSTYFVETVYGGYVFSKFTNFMNVSASSSIYPSRTRAFSYSTEEVQNEIMYLLSSDELQGVVQTFQTLDANTEDSLPLVNVVIEGSVGAATVVLDSGLTDSAGLFTFYGDGAKTYIARFTKSGYSTLTDVFTPSSQTRQERMSPIGLAINESLLSGQSYEFAPPIQTFNNETLVNFTMNMTSTISNITACNFSIFGDTELKNSTLATFNSSFCNATLSLSTANFSQVSIQLLYEKAFELNSSYSVTYSVARTFEGNQSLSTAITRINNITQAGFDDFSRAVLAFLMVFVIVTFVPSTVKGLAKEHESEVLIFLGALFIVSNFGWLTITYPPMVNLNINGLTQYFIFIIHALGGMGLVIPKWVNR